MRVFVSNRDVKAWAGPPQMLFCVSSSCDWVTQVIPGTQSNHAPQNLNKIIINNTVNTEAPPTPIIVHSLLILLPSHLNT
jgi:hypothetical protein